MKLYNLNQYFSKAGKRKQYYEEITLIFTFFLVCWFHEMLKQEYNYNISKPIV